jgi:hypothetical protein
VLRETAFLPTVLPRDIFTLLQELHTARTNTNITATEMRILSKQHNPQILAKPEQTKQNSLQSTKTMQKWLIRDEIRTARMNTR